ncbi:MAG TPA: glycosyl transferase family 2, partial [Thiolinea sp.]|nr:glycosyl transferase family 2 [Thiolinea sp.]
LNEAEKQVLSWPVFYIDADTQLSAGAVQAITNTMAQGQLLLAAPEPIINTAHSSWLVQQYYNVWLSLPYIREGVVATCSFVISAEGRKRFTQFPNVINDDGFVRCQFSPEERGNVTGTQVFITAPQTIKSLIKIKTRARLGNMQLAAAKLCTKPQEKPYSQIMRDKLFSKDFIAVSIYIAIATIIRIRAKQQLKHLANYRWETDHTSRQSQIS